MQTLFIFICNNDSSRTVYRALNRVIKNRRYCYVRTLKIPRTSVPRDKDYWRSTWGKILRNPHVKIPGNNCYYKRFRRRFCISYEFFYPLVQECKQHHLISLLADSIVTGRTKGLKSTRSSSHVTEGILCRRCMGNLRGIADYYHLTIPVPAA